MHLKEELNRIHIKFSGEEQAHRRRNHLLGGYQQFYGQLVNLRNKNIRNGLSEKIDNLVEKDYEINSFDDYKFKKKYTEYRIQRIVRK